MERLGLEMGVFVGGGRLFFIPLMRGKGQSKYTGLLITPGDRSRFRSFIFLRERERVRMCTCASRRLGGWAEGEGKRI